ncbi:OLC1v1036730C1 [Oldenlandia corymbosa var. corymbosa]|uniref:OLC1v1036730C1 n=1 Tax=Oldenlandia corymbosa var. corymbosa TaxID=529605 RepID=A0AAV1CX67_OLDCO|nr:OLC1v1036730C1 [Oldenlandia corymbosa var. corymbosa]
MDRKSPPPESDIDSDGVELGLSVPTSDYIPHRGQRAKILNPESVKPFPDRPRFPPNYRRDMLGDKGPLAFAVIIRDGVLFAVNHTHPVRRRDPHIFSPLAVATISGGDPLDCRNLLRELQAKCMKYERGKMMPGASVKEARRLMLQLLSGRYEVGLVAGWDDKKKRATCYLVDGMGGLVKGHILATGCGFTELDYSDWAKWSRYEAAEFAKRTMCELAYNAPDSGDFASANHFTNDDVIKRYDDVITPAPVIGHRKK